MDTELHPPLNYDNLSLSNSWPHLSLQFYLQLHMSTAHTCSVTLQHHELQHLSGLFNQVYKSHTSLSITLQHHEELQHLSGFCLIMSTTHTSLNHTTTSWRTSTFIWFLFNNVYKPHTSLSITLQHHELQHLSGFWSIMSTSHIHLSITLQHHEELQRSSGCYRSQLVPYLS